MAAPYDTGDGLERQILSWSFSDLNKEQVVDKISTASNSSEEYLTSFKKPLIEEVRSEIKSCLESVNRSEYYKLLSISKGHADGHVYLDIDTCFGQGGGGGHHLTRNDDLFLLSDQVPKDLQLNDNCGVFAIAANVIPGDYFIKSFEAKVDGNVSFDKYTYAIFLCNLKDSICMWRALYLDIGKSSIVKQISTLPMSLSEKNCCGSCNKKSKSLQLCPNHGLTKEQKDLALRIVSNAECSHRESIDIIQGLPGTGKSKTIAAAMAALQGLETKTLVCASTSSDCSSLCCCLNAAIRRSDTYDGPDRKVGDVLLLCDLLEVKDDSAKQFCLEWRLKEIMPCMVWKNKIDGLISLLEKDFREMCNKVTTK